MTLVRYYIAFFLIIAIPSALLFWLLIHPFARFWRRIRPMWAYGSVGTVQVVAMAGIPGPPVSPGGGLRGQPWAAGLGALVSRGCHRPSVLAPALYEAGYHAWAAGTGPGTLSRAADHRRPLRLGPAPPLRPGNPGALGFDFIANYLAVWREFTSSSCWKKASCTGASGLAYEDY